MTHFSWTQGGIASPEGFLAAGVYCGIKKKKKEDLTLIYSEAPALAAGTFTQNHLVAWPVEWTRKVVNFPYHNAILATSGNANCFNGPSGKKAVELALSELSNIIDAPKESILVAQTGVIGKPFPVEVLKRGISDVYDKLSSKAPGAARGILTTDTQTKEFSLTYKVKGKRVKMGSIAKGAGMVHPDMATMLTFITTDLNISKTLLQKLLKKAVGETFNRMSIDNDLSTNDCVLILANGLAGNKKLISEKDAHGFYEALVAICKEQRSAMVEDGEGTTKVCEVQVRHAKTEKEAEKIARQIANSMLFKTMLAGEDPNWGRVAAAVGSTKIPADLKKMEIGFNEVPVFKNGVPQTKNLKRAHKILQKKSFKLKVDLKRGKEQVDFVTSDLTKDYVKINSEYTT